jgi:hypothetical protein
MGKIVTKFGRKNRKKFFLVEIAGVAPTWQ